MASRRSMSKAGCDGAAFVAPQLHYMPPELRQSRHLGGITVPAILSAESSVVRCIQQPCGVPFRSRGPVMGDQTPKLRPRALSPIWATRGTASSSQNKLPI